MNCPGKRTEWSRPSGNWNSTRSRIGVQWKKHGQIISFQIDTRVLEERYLRLIRSKSSQKGGERFLVSGNLRASPVLGYVAESWGDSKWI